jgi:ABC-type uncharacterized transport system permease subunit
LRRNQSCIQQLLKRRVKKGDLDSKQLNPVQQLLKRRVKKGDLDSKQLNPVQQQLNTRLVSTQRAPSCYRFLGELQDTYRLVLLGPFLLIACGMCVNTFSILLVRNILIYNSIRQQSGTSTMRKNT